MDENAVVLNEIHKGACMGKDAIDFILDKVGDSNLIKELKREYKDYQIIESRVDKIYKKYDNGNPDSTTTMNKAMTWSGIEMRTIADKSTSKIAELLLQGVNMGIIEGRKILNNKELNSEVHDIASVYVSMQEKSVENLKKFL